MLKNLGFIVLLALLVFPGAAIAEPAKTAATDKVYFDYFPDNPDINRTLDGGVAQVKKARRLSRASADKLTAQVTSVESVVDNGPSSNRVSIVFLGDGFTANQLPEFKSLVATQAADLFTRRAPYVQYAPYFNVYRVDVASNESGVDNDPKGVMKDTAFDSGYWCGGLDRLICLDTNKVALAAAAAPRADQKLVMIHSNTWGGAGYPGLGTATIVSGYGYYNTEIIIHEMGHSLGLLADEYDYGGPTTYVGAEPSAPNVTKLTAASMKSLAKKWSGWVGNKNATYNGLVGSYLGASYSPKGIYRPTYDSEMRNVGKNFNMPSLEAMVTEIYKKIKPIDTSTDNTNILKPTDVITISVLRPTDHALNVDWSVDGVKIAASTGAKTFNIATRTLSAGLHKVSVTVVDNTPWVKNATAKANYLTQVKSWQVIAGDASKAPVITQQPADVTVMEESTATFSVAATSSSAMKYQWLKNGQAISGATGASYSIKGMRGGNAAYSCVVSNTLGGIQSSPASLTVNIPTAPALTVQPITQTGMVLENSTMSYSVTATSTGPIHYQWQKNGVNIAGATSATYSFKAAMSMTGAWYQCIVSNGSGTSTSSYVRLIVTALKAVSPTIYRHPSSVTVYGTTYVGFVTQATTLYGPLTYQWYKNNVAIPGATNFTYFVTADKTFNKNVYSCAVKNPYATVRTNGATLLVK